MIWVRISIKEAKKALASVVGAVQSTLGVLAVIFAYLLSINFFRLQESLKVPPEFLPFYMLILTVFGFFSIISGLFLLTEIGGSP